MAKQETCTAATVRSIEMTYEVLGALLVKHAADPDFDEQAAWSAARGQVEEAIRRLLAERL